MDLLRDVHIRDIIIFGTGEIGKIAVHLLEKQYHILFAVDNEEIKWGNSFEGYSIKPPTEILDYDSNIVIVTTKSLLEISKQLCRLGVSLEKIFFCSIESDRNENEYAFYPLDAKNLAVTGKSLIQYDLLCEKEQRTNNKNVLIFCSFYSVYTKQLIENISKRYNDIEFSILTKAEKTNNTIKSEH